MDVNEMIRRIENGEHLIDITIDKWKDIANGTGFCLGIANCALCSAYIRYRCVDCPICRFTGYSSCDSTPFRDWWRHYMEEHYCKDPETRKCPVCKEIANREVEFLEKVKSFFL
jgi:hypothetical protein